MKVIITHNGTKRVIVGGFNICGPRKDVINMADQIKEFYNKSTGSYGWIQIDGGAEPVPDTSPIPWSAEGKVEKSKTYIIKRIKDAEKLLNDAMSDYYELSSDNFVEVETESFHILGHPKPLIHVRTLVSKVVTP